MWSPIKTYNDYEFDSGRQDGEMYTRDMEGYGYPLHRPVTEGGLVRERTFHVYRPNHDTEYILTKTETVVQTKTSGIDSNGFPVYRPLLEVSSARDRPSPAAYNPKYETDNFVTKTETKVQTDNVPRLYPKSFTNKYGNPSLNEASSNLVPDPHAISTHYNPYPAEVKPIRQGRTGLPYHVQY